MVGIEEDIEAEIGIETIVEIETAAIGAVGTEILTVTEGTDAATLAVERRSEKREREETQAAATADDWIRLFDSGHVLSSPLIDD